MHFVLLAEHSAEVCPTSNAKTRDLVLQMSPQIPEIAEKAGVTMVAGPFVNRDHLTVAVVEAERAEDVDDFLVQTRLPQWNTMRIMPSLPLAEGMKEVQDGEMLF